MMIFYFQEQSVHKRVPRLLKEVPKPVPRPETPTQHGPGVDFEERQIAATLLQKLIRGMFCKYVFRLSIFLIRRCIQEENAI